MPARSSLPTPSPPRRSTGTGGPRAHARTGSTAAPCSSDSLKHVRTVRHLRRRRPAAADPPRWPARLAATPEDDQHPRSRGAPPAEGQQIEQEADRADGRAALPRTRRSGQSLTLIGTLGPGGAAVAATGPAWPQREGERPRHRVRIRRHDPPHHQVDADADRPEDSLPHFGTPRSGEKPGPCPRAARRPPPRGAEPNPTSTGSSKRNTTEDKCCAAGISSPSRGEDDTNTACAAAGAAKTDRRQHDRRGARPSAAMPARPLPVGHPDPLEPKPATTGSGRTPR